MTKEKLRGKLICLAVLVVVILLLLMVSQGKIDALTGPSHRKAHAKVILAEKDNYTVYLNKDQTAGAAQILCTVPKKDTNAEKMAKLLKKQAGTRGVTLEIREEDPLLAVSKMEDGKLEMLVVSSATKEQYQTDTLRKKKFITVMRPEGKQLEES